MSKQSYMTGFCKAASAAGVDPQALAQYVMSKKAAEDDSVRDAFGIDLENLFGNAPEPTDDARPSELDRRTMKFLADNARGSGVVDPINSEIGGVTVGDVIRSRDRVLNPTPMERIAIEGLSPFARDNYTAMTNSYDVATAPFVGMNSTNTIPSVVDAQQRLAGIRNYLTHPALKKYIKQAK